MSERIICQNAGGKIVGPSCLRSEARVYLEIRYDDAESDRLMLCRGCAEVIRKDARRRGYLVIVHTANL